MKRQSPIILPRDASRGRKDEGVLRELRVFVVNLPFGWLALRHHSLIR